MAKWLRFALGVCILLAVLVSGAQLTGQHQTMPRSIAQFHLGDCSPPCWIGIIPGVTTIAQAKARLIATYSGQSGLQIKDSGFADGPVYSHVVENTIEGDNFSLLVRLNIGELIDAQTEIVQSIGLFESRPDRRLDAPTVRDILSTFGAPRSFAEEETLSLGREITLSYAGIEVVYYTRVDRPPLDEIPRFYLGGSTLLLPDSEFHPWTWFATLGQD